MNKNESSFGKVILGIAIVVVLRCWGIGWISRAAMYLEQKQHPEIKWIEQNKPSQLQIDRWLRSRAD